MTAIILAAGKSSRMGKGIPKVLLVVQGRPLIAYVAQSVRQAGVDRVIAVVGTGREKVQAALDGQGIEFAFQVHQQGTADAVLSCRDLVATDEECVVVYGDVPLMSGASIRVLVERRRKQDADVAVLTATLDDPHGYGRIIRGDGDCIEQIVEERDAVPETRAIREVNSGFCAFVWGRILPALLRVRPSPASGEYYLTDVVRDVRSSGGRVIAVPMCDPTEMLGVNTPAQLELVTSEMARRTGGRHQ